MPWLRVPLADPAGKVVRLSMKTRARGGFGLLHPPSLSPWAGPAAPCSSQACAAVAGSSPARGRAWVPLLSESAPTPAKRGKKCSFPWLVAEKIPSSGTARGWLEPLGGISWAELVSPQQGCAHRDPQRVCPRWGQHEVPGRPCPGAAPSVLRGAFVLRDFQNAAVPSERGKSRLSPCLGAALGKVQLCFLRQRVSWGWEP